MDPRLVDDVSLNVLAACATADQSRFSHSLHASLRKLAPGLEARDSERLHGACARLADAVRGTRAEHQVRVVLGLVAEKEENGTKWFGHNIRLDSPYSASASASSLDCSFLCDLAADEVSTFSLGKELTFDLDKARALQERHAAALAQHSKFSGPRKDAHWLEEQIKVCDDST